MRGVFLTGANVERFANSYEPLLLPCFVLEALLGFVEGEAADGGGDVVEAEGVPAVEGHEVAIGGGVALDGEDAWLLVDAEESEVDEGSAEAGS